MTKKKKELDDLREWAIRHQHFSELIEHLLFAGWIDQERISDMIATHLIENPYGINPAKRLIEKDNKNK